MDACLNVTPNSVRACISCKLEKSIDFFYTKGRSGKFHDTFCKKCRLAEKQKMRRKKIRAIEVRKNHGCWSISEAKVSGHLDSETLKDFGQALGFILWRNSNEQ
jgi:hypothetical protein